MNFPQLHLAFANLTCNIIADPIKSKKSATEESSETIGFSDTNNKTIINTIIKTIS